MKIVDRYSATGTPVPDPATMCDDCEGMGCFPLYDDRALAGKYLHRKSVTRIEKLTGDDKAAWETAHANAGNHVCDGWHIVPCPVCHGTRLRKDLH